MASDESVRPGDGKRGCPVRYWDGPYEMRCDLGASAGGPDPAIGQCAYHGRFEQPAVDTRPRPSGEVAP